MALPPDVVELSMASTYLRQFAEQVRELGVDVESWLFHSGLSMAALDDAARELPFGTFEKLVVDAIERTGEPALGLFVGQRLGIHTHGALGYAALSSQSIRQALALVESFLRTRFSLVELKVEDVRDEVRLLVKECHPLGLAKRPVFEAVLMGTKNVLDAISSGRCRVDAASFPFDSPPYAKLSEKVFGCRVRYRRTWAGFAFRREVVDAPLRAADPAAFREAVRICERELELSRTETLAGRIRRLLLERQGGFPSLEVVARVLSLTPRTMHRRLVEEGTTFRALLDDVRHRLAVEHLKSGRLSLKELASTLGYLDFANFRRAFKRWEGVPPKEYQKRHLRPVRAARTDRKPGVR